MNPDCGYSYEADAWLRPCYTRMVYISFNNITADTTSGLMTVNGATEAAGLVSETSVIAISKCQDQ